jgi:hypothetical protein
VSTIPDGGAEPGTYHIAGRSNRGPREAEVYAGVATTGRKTEVEMLLSDVHSWICRHCKAAGKGREEKQTSQYSPEGEAAFQSLKKSQCMTLILGYLHLGEKFTVNTEVSNAGIGGVWSQM